MTKQEWNKLIETVPKTLSENQKQEISQIIQEIQNRFFGKSNIPKQEKTPKIQFSEEQLKAINCNKKYILLKARAGSGKTAVLVERVKKLLKSGVSQNEILLLAFNKKASEEMKNRISKEFQNSKTFHSFAYRIVQPKKLLIEKEYEKFLKKLISEENETKLTKISEISSYIQNAKQRGFSPKDMEKKVEKYPQHRFSNKIYSQYENFEKIDFLDLLKLATEKLSKDNIGNLKYILIDEFQDFTPLFFKLIQKIIEIIPEVYIFAVGDDWQGINGFAGADLKYFHNFSNYFPKAEILTMVTNFRTPEKIVEFSNSILEGTKSIANRKGGEIIRTSQLPKDRKIMVIIRNNFEKDNFQTYKNLKFITAHKSKGLEFDEVAIVKNSYNKLHPNSPNFAIFGKSESEILEEENRLFYVAVTRAKEKLYILQ
jgi:superfamily I DNA/RNA helicase